MVCTRACVRRCWEKVAAISGTPSSLGMGRVEKERKDLDEGALRGDGEGAGAGGGFLGYRGSCFC